MNAATRSSAPTAGTRPAAAARSPELHPKTVGAPCHHVSMATWQQFAEEAPELAETARNRFTEHRHHVLATVRKNGAPRVSGTEVFWYGPDLAVGSMPKARKALDLLRDGRFALHCNPGGETMTEPDVKISGHAEEVLGKPREEWLREAQPPGGDGHLFRLELNEVVATAVAEDQSHLVIRLWRPHMGIATFHRY